MNDIKYRDIELHECDQIKQIDPSQLIVKAWRQYNGKLQLVNINYHDSDWPNGYDYHHRRLRETIIASGIAIGAFNKNKELVGFTTINRGFFGTNCNYVLLDQLYISLQWRGKGIGKKLFMFAANSARNWDADKIYICAGSAEETIEFYNSIGCKSAEEINMELLGSDPRDIQLEYDLR